MDHYASSADCHDWFGHHLQCNRRQLPAQFLHNCVPQEWHGRVPFSRSICLDYCLFSHPLGHHSGDCLPFHSFLLSFALALACVCPCTCLFLCQCPSVCAYTLHLKYLLSCTRKSCAFQNHNAEGAVDHLQAPNFNSLSGVSLAAAFMSLSYSTMWASSQTLCTTSMATPKLRASLVYSMRLERWLLLMEATMSFWRFRWASVCASSQPIKTAAPVLCQVWTLADLRRFHCKPVCMLHVLQMIS